MPTYVRPESASQTMRMIMTCVNRCGYYVKLDFDRALGSIPSAQWGVIEQQIRDYYDQHACGSGNSGYIMKMPKTKDPGGALGSFQIDTLINVIGSLSQRQAQAIYELLYKSYGCRIYKP